MKFFIITLLFIITLTYSYSSSHTTVKIGGLFFLDETDLIHAFDTAINDLNELRFDVRLESVKHFLNEDDSIVLQKLTCELIENGVAAIVGPSSKASSDIVENICNNTGIPHLQFDWHSEKSLRHRNNYQMTVNVAPTELVLAKAYFEILRVAEWTSFTFVYESEESFSRMRQLFAWKQMNKLGIKVLKFNRGDDYRILWKNVRATNEKFVVLDCPSDIVTEVVNASVYYNMTGRLNHLLLTNLDTHTSNLETLSSKKFLIDIKAVRIRQYIPPPVLDEIDMGSDEENEKIISTRSILLYDAMILFFRSINTLIELEEYYPPQLSCTPENFWKTGYDILQIMPQLKPKKFQLQYKTQRLQLNEFRERDDFNLEVYNPMIGSVSYVWNKDYRKIKKQPELNKVGNAPKEHEYYIIATRVGKPYFMYREEPEGVHYEDNERFEGYVVDLMFELGKNLQFKFKFEPVADNNYGSKNPVTGEWNGIIRELINHNAHLGICDLTITQERREAVDFTVPFMQLGISILHYRPKPKPTELFAFLMYYDFNVWFSMILTVILSSIVLIFIARTSEVEWEPPELNKDNVLEQETIWSWANVIWLSIGSNLGAGCYLLPRGFAMRLCVATMWILTLIVVQTYTAKIAAVINASKLEGSINNLHELVHQDKIKFGTIRGGATALFFSELNDTDYRKAWSTMQTAKPDVFTPSNELGVERVKHGKGDYAFLMETTNLQYNTWRNCELKQIGEHFGEKHYGIAMPLNSPYRSNMSVGILGLSEKGFLFTLKQKWFFNETIKCDDSIYAAKTETSTFTVDSVRGIFLVLGAGTVLALLIATFEFLWNVERISVEEKIPFTCALKPEVEFFFKFWLQRKPLHTHRTSNRDSPSMSYSSIDKTTSGTIAKRKKNARKRKAKKKGETVAEQLLSCFL